MKLPRNLDGDALANRLSSLGFSKVRQVGSHIQLRHAGTGELVTVPAHRPLKVGTLSGIIRDVMDITGKSREDVLAALSRQEHLKENLALPETVEDYIAQANPQVQSLLQELRHLIRDAAPQAEERISYQMPAYFYKGALVYFGAFKNHVSLFGTASGLEEIFREKLRGYKTSKGTIQFPLSKPLPSALIRAMIHERVRQNEERALTKASGRSRGKE